MKAEQTVIQIYLLCAAMLPAVAQEQFDYTTNNGTITITGYDGPGGVVNIPEIINGLPVTGIGDHAFYGVGFRAYSIRWPLKQLPSIESSNSVTRYPRTLPMPLTSITIPNSVTSIGNEAFESSTSLTNVVMGNSVTNLGKRTFIYCNRLANIKIPDSVTCIGIQLFAGCTSLTNITIPSKVTNIENGAFDACRNLTAIKIPDSVTNIGDQAFEECFSLTNVIFGNSLAKIGDNAFVQCRSLTSLTIPSSVTYIGSYVFSGCDRLTAFYFKGSPPEIRLWGNQGWDLGCGIPTYNALPGSILHSGTILYYLPGATGWGEKFDGYPTALWKQ
jgi:hypothetical protein